MALTDTFYDAVKSGNVLRVRIMMKNSLLVDPTFAEFHAMEKAALSMKGLYDEHDGEEFCLDESAWNDEYMNKVMVRVLDNFSHERIEHLKKVVRHCRPPKQPVPVPVPGPEPKSIGTGAVVGAAVGGVIAGVAGSSVGGVVACAVVGAVVGGSAIAVIGRKLGGK